jgi:hypothetical protein
MRFMAAMEETLVIERIKAISFLLSLILLKLPALAPLNRYIR